MSQFSAKTVTVPVSHLRRRLTRLLRGLSMGKLDKVVVTRRTKPRWVIVSDDVLEHLQSPR